MIMKVLSISSLLISSFLHFNVASFMNFDKGMSPNLQGHSMLFLNEIWPKNVGKHEYKDGDISKQCMTHLNTFSNVTSRFINCTVTNSRPLRYCKNCVSEYVSVQNAFTLIWNDGAAPENNCREQILRADTIQLSLRTHKFVQSIWESSTCDLCFDPPIINTSQPSTMTQTLLKKISVTLDCFKDFSLYHNDSDSNNSVCGKCKTLYCEADDYYEMVEQEGKLCSDLIDSMNYTRLAWAGKYNCTIALPDTGVIWVITALVFLLPFLLYIGVVFYDKRYASRFRGFEDSYCQDLDGSD